MHSTGEHIEKSTEGDTCRRSRSLHRNNLRFRDAPTRRCIDVALLEVDVESRVRNLVSLKAHRVEWLLDVKSVVAVCPVISVVRKLREGVIPHPMGVPSRHHPRDLCLRK
ncbi:hypothetical protein TNCV_3390551 [Trichonephila clavipes]|nr:hypothetical protein TNCV_3390551 [Trichonephila clavipes]